jgi:oxygen-independent coproporphyrinogen-3 oxidase
VSTLIAPETITASPIPPAPAPPRDLFGVYIHVPFCAHICPYCDFNTFSGQETLIPDYVEATKRETTMWSGAFAGRAAGSIFFGGGTPSLLEPSQIGSLVAACQLEFDVAPDAEITVEANPNDLSERYCAGLLAAGVNRLSIGAQTLQHRGLRILGRLHEASQVAAAVSAARVAGFQNVSLDFIYGWPGQTLPQWEDDLAQVLMGGIDGSRPDHLSLYSLIVEPGTPMADAVQRGIYIPVDEDRVADFYEHAISMLAEVGWKHYEISNWSASAQRVSRHNAVYWRNGDYAGIGAGAHGHVADRRSMNQPSPRRYIDLVMNGGTPTTNVEIIDERTAMAETMMLGLRLLNVGVSNGAFTDRHGVSLQAAYGPQLERLAAIGMIHWDGHVVRLTSRGSFLANSVCAEFL